MRYFLIMLFLFPLALLAQNSNYNAIASGRVRLEGRSSFAPSFEIFVDSFTTLEQGSVNDLLTLDYLTNSTISVGQFGWAYIPVSGGNTTFKRTYVGSNTFALPKATIAMGPSQYTTAGSRSASYDSNTNAVNEVAEFILPGGSGGNKTVVSFGMMIQFCATNSSATQITNQFITMNGPPYGALVQEVSVSLNRVRAIGTLNDGTLEIGGAIPIEPCKIYWITGHRDVAEGHCGMSLYDPVDGALVGESVAAMGTTNVTWNIQIGNVTTSLATSGNTYWDNFIVNYHDGFYPLGPLKTTPPPPAQEVAQNLLFGEDGTGILGESSESIILE